MKENTPKTSQQLGAEAKALYAEHKQVEAALFKRGRLIHSYIGLAIAEDGNVRALESGKKRLADGSKLTKKDVNEARANRDFYLDKLGQQVLEQGVFQDEVTLHNQKAETHYKQNTEGYYDMAVVEDGQRTIVAQIQQAADPGVEVPVEVK